MFIVIYRPHGKLNIETQYHGPFTRWEYADDFLCTLPAIGIAFTQKEQDHPGVKYIQELVAPPSHKVNTDDSA